MCELFFYHVMIIQGLICKTKNTGRNFVVGEG